MPTWGVLALAGLVACEGSGSGGSLLLSVRRSVDIPRSTGSGTISVEVDRSDPNDAVSISLEDPPAGLTADALQFPAGTTTASWTLRSAARIDASVTVAAKSASGLVARARVHVMSDLVGGIRDDSFGDRGATASLDGTQWACESALAQPDGKVVILLAGDLTVAGGVLRVTDGGVLDPGFGAGGIAAILTSPGHAIGVTRGLVQPDGKLLAFGFDTDQGRFSLPRVWRLQADGSIDDTFQLDASFGNGVSDSVQSATLRADGKIDVFLSGDPTGTVARLTASGSLDAGFGIGGKVLTSGSSSLLIELDDGNWLGLDQTSHSFEIVTPDGTRVATSVPVPAFGAPVVRPTTGGFVVASGPLDAGGASVLLRLRSDLSLDPAFGAGGILQFSDFTLQDMALTSDGKIVIAGNGFVARLDPNGSIDSSFRNGTEADLGDLVGGGQACLRGLVVDAQDRITFAWTNLGHELRLVRFLP